MADQQILEKVSERFACEGFWRPIIVFMYTNCAQIQTENPLNEDFQCFHKFCQLLEQTFEKEICAPLNLPSERVESVLFSSYQRGNFRSQVILNTLLRFTDYLGWRDQMKSTDERIQGDAADALERYRSSQALARMSDEDAAGSIADILEQQENATMEFLVHKTMKQMSDALKIDMIGVSNPEPKKKVKSTLPPLQNSPVGQVKPRSSIGRTSISAILKPNK